MLSQAQSTYGHDAAEQPHGVWTFKVSKTFTVSKTFPSATPTKCQAHTPCASCNRRKTINRFRNPTLRLVATQACGD